MDVFKRKPKKFGYIPRYYKGEGNPYEIKHKLDEFRTTVGKNQSLKNKLSTAYHELSLVKVRGVNKTILLIISVLVLLFLWFIDFELSIFLPKN